MAFDWRQPNPVNHEYSRCKYVAPSPEGGHKYQRPRHATEGRRPSEHWLSIVCFDARMLGELKSVRVVQSMVEKDTVIGRSILATG